jgi:hypothetical protein
MSIAAAKPIGSSINSSVGIGGKGGSANGNSGGGGSGGGGGAAAAASAAGVRGSLSGGGSQRGVRRAPPRATLAPPSTSRPSVFVPRRQSTAVPRSGDGERRQSVAGLASGRLPGVAVTSARGTREDRGRASMLPIEL